ISFTVSASDIDVGQTPTFTATGLPDGASFTQITLTSWQFNWTPVYTQQGSYAVTFKVSDNGSPLLSDTKTVMITVDAKCAQTSGIEGGVIDVLFADGVTIFACANNSGVFRSTDNGRSWLPTNAGLTNLNVFSFAMNGTGLFVGTAGGVFRSTD